MEQTGNRWRDPDKVYNPDGSKKPREEWDNSDSLANAGNIKLNEFRGPDAQKRKYGPALRENGSEPEAAEQVAGVVEAHIPDRAARAAAAVAAAHAPPRMTEDLPEIPTGKINPAAFDRIPNRPAVQAETATGQGIPDDMPGLIDQIKAFGPKAQGGDPAATAELNRIATDEYNRGDGGRMPIVKRLSAYGIKRPEAAK